MRALPYTTPVQIGGSVNGPIGLALDNQGNLYVADTGNGRIVKIHVQGVNFGDQTANSNGNSLSELVFAGGGYSFVSSNPFEVGINSTGEAFDGAGSFYLGGRNSVSQGSQLVSIEKFVPEPVFLSGPWTTGISSVGSLINVSDFESIGVQYPRPMGVDGSGNVYILTDNWDILKATLNGNAYTVSEIYQYSSGGKEPQYLAVDSAGDLYVGSITPGRRADSDGNLDTDGERLHAEHNYKQTRISRCGRE